MEKEGGGGERRRGGGLDHNLFPNLPVVLFPGNVGDIDGLVTVFKRLK